MKRHHILEGPPLLACLFVLLVAVGPINAQEITDLRVETYADTDQATPGQRVTLTIALNNEGSQALEGLTVTKVTPPGTAFVGAAAPGEWTITTPRQGQAGEVIWRCTSPLPAGESAELSLLVVIEAQAGTTVTSEGCTIEAQGWDEALIGPGLEIPVVEPTPTSPADTNGEGGDQRLTLLLIAVLLASAGAALALRLGQTER